MPIEFTTEDPEEFARAVSSIADGVQVDKVRTGAFSSDVRGYPLSSLGLMRVRCANISLNTESSRDYTSLTIPLTTGFRVRERRKDQDFAPGDVHLLNPDRPFDFRLRSGSVMVMNFDNARLAAMSAGLRGEREQRYLKFAPRWSLSSRQGAAFWRITSHLWRVLEQDTGEARSPVALSELEQSAAHRLLMADDVLQADWQKLSSGNRRSARLALAEDWIVANLHEPLSRADICAVSGVDVRTLSRAFHDKFGMGPMQFVRARRLDAVNRLLLGLDPTATTVTDIALRYGFHHLSRFAADYRNEFAELPSETLKR